MMKFITSLLDFLKHGPASHSDPLPADVEKGYQASCQGWPRPDPDVHLRISANRTVRIFGYPRERDIPPDVWIPFPGFGNSGSPLLYVRGYIPAYVSYIMGEDWRSRLRDDHHTNDAHMFHDGEVILRPSAIESPLQGSQEHLDSRESAHCLRMRRCGAVAVRSEMDIICEETGIESWPRYLLGWPADGGVWILRAYAAEHLRVNLVSETAVIDDMDERFRLAYEAIRQQIDMDELCRILMEAGGRFYPNIEDCPEAKRLSLLE